MTPDVVNLLDRAIAVLDNVHAPAVFPGLDSVRRRLREMRQEVIEGKSRGPKDRRGDLARMVIDSWPLNSPATTAVVEAEAGYLRS